MALLIVYGVGAGLTAVAYGLAACVGLSMSHDDASLGMVLFGLVVALGWPLVVPYLWWRWRWEGA